MDVDITNNANTLGFHFDFATRYAESVKVSQLVNTFLDGLEIIFFSK